MTGKLAHSLARTAAPNYTAPAIQALEEWRAEYIAANPTCNNLIQTAGIMRRIIQLHRAGDSFAEIARCCGLSSGQSAKAVWVRLPEHLR